MKKLFAIKKMGNLNGGRRYENGVLIVQFSGHVDLLIGLSAGFVHKSM